MNEIKYTTDGKKVVVIGSLNSTDKIVQEIFIIDGSEIPSGEHFVVKSLHDKPAVSWKESELNRLNEIFEKEQKSFNNAIDGQRKEYYNNRDLLRGKLQYIGAALKKASEDSFELLVNYICGNITHVVVYHYNTPELKTFDEFCQLYDGQLRLISLFGKDDGTFTYAIGEYYDFSGGNKAFFPFTNYDDAFEKFKELLLKADVTDDRLQLANINHIEYPTEKVTAFYQKKRDALNKNIENYQANIAKWNDELSRIKDTK